jgi:hypothetical protein
MVISNQHQSVADAQLSDEEFQAKALEFNAERNTLKLQFVSKIPQDVKKYEIYSNHVLKIGTSITSADGLSSAQIEEVDAEWHRDQPWALKTEHMGKPVRWVVATLRDDDG